MTRLILALVLVFCGCATVGAQERKFVAATDWAIVRLAQ